MRRKYYIALLAALAVSIMIGSTAFVLLRPYFQKNINFNIVKPPEVIEEPAEKVIPFPGWRDKDRQRALAVVIDNAAAARPQSGLELADVVIEMPVEGGMTRLLAIISGEDLELLGPIRSARSYFVDLAKEYKAILVHAGGSMDALDAIKTEKLNNLDEINGGSNVATAFWRVTERAKPHNLYSSSDSLRKAAVNKQYNLTTPPTQLPYLLEGEESEGEIVSDITIFYPNRLSLIRYQFNKEKLYFERFMGEEPHMTAKNEQLKAANIIIQFVSYQYLDGEGRLRLIMHGKGKALIFREGKFINGLWEKQPGQFTKYTDSKGKTLSFVEGPTWIEVVPNGTRIEY
ncbi:MAG: DUF3048 domain-containing protein [Clostridia bacterium]|nr:DUF3048 domain-containing protein [Clostridia bacterium]